MFTPANSPRAAGGALRSGARATLNSTGLFNFN